MRRLREWSGLVWPPWFLSCFRRPGRPACRRQLEVVVLESRALPSVVGTGTGLTGQYYSDQNLTTLKLTRTDPEIDFNWGANPNPAPNVPGDHFSVRWTGQVEAPDTGLYTFYTHSDDGIRLIVNGTVLINDWTTHALKEDQGKIQLVAGHKYSIEIDYFQNTGSAVAQLFWKTPTVAWQVVPKDMLYPKLSPPPPPAPPRPPADKTPPTASLSAGNVTVPGATTYTFSVIYKDNVAILGSSIHSGNVFVTWPNGFSESATLVSVNQAGNGSERIATYRITTPGGKWDGADHGVYTVSEAAGQVKDTSGNFVKTGAVGTFQVLLTGSDWFSSNLHDPGLISLTRSLDADGSLSRTDMIAIFREAESGGVTATKLADLKTIVENSDFFKMPDYVRDLSYKVVFGDPANASYLGGYLGNLHAGSSGSQLEKLVDKWFLGTDHPATDPGLSYGLASGSLFGSGPAYTDVVQGMLDDCYFVAGLADTAFRSPSAIRSMFIDNGDGTYTVRFYNNGVADYVTVDKYLPMYSNGTFAYANLGESLGDPNNKLWVALAEKAYAEEAASGWTRGAGKANAYESIATGWEGDVIGQVTGRAEAFQQVFNTAANFVAVTSDFAAGHFVTLDSNQTTSSGIIADHVYVLVGYNSTTHVFTLYNPWGSSIQVVWSQIATNFGDWSINTT